MTATEKKLLTLSDRYAATLNHDARDQIRAEYQALHAQWLRSQR